MLYRFFKIIDKPLFNSSLRGTKQSPQNVLLHVDCFVPCNKAKSNILKLISKALVNIINTRLILFNKLFLLLFFLIKKVTKKSRTNANFIFLSHERCLATPPKKMQFAPFVHSYRTSIKVRAFNVIRVFLFCKNRASRTHDKLILFLFDKQFVKIKIAAYLLITAFITSCNHTEEHAAITQITDTTKVVDTIASPTFANIKINQEVDDIASYIAGLVPQSMDSVLTTNKVWEKYCENSNKNWKKSDTTTIDKIKKWSKEELVDVKSKTIFYPFSGADFLNAYSFFPTAKEFILVGLEPVGTLPGINKELSIDSLPNYFTNINQSLYTILNFSFFRTQNMRKDFKNKDLNGTIHLILVFMKRTGNSIVDVKPIALNSSGEVISYDSFDACKKDTLKNRAVEIDFVDSDSVIKKVYYFSINLANGYLDKNTSFLNFIDKHTSEAATYVKSASYLMHENYFSFVRNLIINKSTYVLQDDSGIPYRFFSDSVWAPSLYGTYDGTIPMFNAFVQKNLKTAYNDSTHIIKKLHFGIGYKHRIGQSNLLFFKKNEKFIGEQIITTEQNKVADVAVKKSIKESVQPVKQNAQSIKQ